MITVEAIVNAAAQEFGVTVLDIKSARHHASLVQARHVAMYLARHLTPRSLPEIGRFLGGRDHTTVMYGVRRTEERMGAAPELAARVARLRDRIEREAAQCA
jgi:chromosomal replication initiator protein